MESYFHIAIQVVEINLNNFLRYVRNVFTIMLIIQEVFFIIFTAADFTKWAGNVLCGSRITVADIFRNSNENTQWLQ